MVSTMNEVPRKRPSTPPAAAPGAFEPPLEVVNENKRFYAGLAGCSVLITVAAANLLDGKTDEEKKALRESGLPWEVWEGKKRVKMAAELEPLQVNEMDVVTGSTKVIVADLLEAVLQTHPGWTVKKLLDATSEENEEDEAQAAAESEADKAARIAEERKRAALAALDAAQGAVNQAQYAVEMADRAARSGAASDAENARDALAKAADAAVQVADAATSAEDPTDLYRNFTVWVNINGERDPAEWVVLPIDMCVHGGC